MATDLSVVLLSHPRGAPQTEFPVFPVFPAVVFAGSAPAKILCFPLSEFPQFPQALRQSAPRRAVLFSRFRTFGDFPHFALAIFSSVTGVMGRSQEEGIAGQESTHLSESQQ